MKRTLGADSKNEFEPARMYRHKVIPTSAWEHSHSPMPRARQCPMAPPRLMLYTQDSILNHEELKESSQTSAHRFDLRQSLNASHSVQLVHRTSDCMFRVIALVELAPPRPQNLLCRTSQDSFGRTSATSPASHSKTVGQMIAFPKHTSRQMQ